MALQDALLTVNKSTLTNNQANGQTAEGGGLYALNSTGVVENSTVKSNQANGSVLGEGGGIYSYDQLYNTLLTLMTDIISGNSATTNYNDVFNGV